VSKTKSKTTDRAGRAALCSMIGTYPCIVGASISGYAEGKEQTRDKIHLERQAKEVGIKVDDCFKLNPFYGW
jgi:hypothetical protein